MTKVAKIRGATHMMKEGKSRENSPATRRTWGLEKDGKPAATSMTKVAKIRGAAQYSKEKIFIEN